MLNSFSMFGSGVDLESTQFTQMGLSTLAQIFSRHFQQVKYGGSNGGVMYKFACEFAEHGGQVMGIHTQSLVDIDCVAQFHQAITANDLSHRKQLLLQDIDAILALPGGFGTLDEVFTYLAQYSFKEDARKIPIFFYDYNGYYRPLELMFQVMNESGALQLDNFDIYFFESMDSFAEQLKQLEIESQQ